MENDIAVDGRPPHLPLPAALLLAAVCLSICGNRAAAQGTAGLLREKQPQLCYSCHRDVEAEFKLPVRHRVNEGLIKCTDCHNTHGALTARDLKSVGTDICTTCHVEKKGPFAYEHAAVLVEGCTVCHTPHGTINLHLLKRRQERQLCLECHAAPQAVNVPHPRLGFQAAGECTRCHVQIHGSNYQPQFLR